MSRSQLSARRSRPRIGQRWFFKLNSKFAVIRVDSGALTSGLARGVGFEIELKVSNGALVDACCNLARFLAQYVLDAKSKLRPGDTIDWASSLLKARQLAKEG